MCLPRLIRTLRLIKPLSITVTPEHTRMYINTHECKQKHSGEKWRFVVLKAGWWGAVYQRSNWDGWWKVEWFLENHPHSPGCLPIIPNSLHSLLNSNYGPTKLCWSGTLSPLPPFNNWRQEIVKSKTICDVLWCLNVWECAHVCREWGGMFLAQQKEKDRWTLFILYRMNESGSCGVEFIFMKDAYILDTDSLSVSVQWCFTSTSFQREIFSFTFIKKMIYKVILTITLLYLKQMISLKHAFITNSTIYQGLWAKHNRVCPRCRHWKKNEVGSVIFYFKAGRGQNQLIIPKR